MQIRLMPRVEDIIPEYIEESDAIVIDMLRATSVIVTALKNGAKEVVPVLSVEEALKFKQEDSACVLGGERKGIKIDGFDAGNSPLEYSEDYIRGKSLIITTSNGTRAIRGCRGARNILIGSMLNGASAARKAAADEADISIVCAGTLGKFSLDDFLCAGYIIDEILKLHQYELDDISFLAHHTFVENRYNIDKFIYNAYHSRYLKSIGMEEDIKYCCSLGITDIVPVYKDGAIVAE